MTSLLGITVRKQDDVSDWYSQIITKAEMIDYHHDVSGCYILLPWSYAIWEEIQKFLDQEIKRSGVSNAYFPLLVSQSALTREKDHIEGFAPEVAWVTRAGSSDLAEPLAIRPTSETIIYPYVARRVRSYRDMPLRLNQWCNVLRWEFKHAIPFLRSREFLWQEGHSAFATQAEADHEVLEILQIYRRVLEDILAIPVILGRKTELEKFAGGLYTTTCEAFIPASGRGIQAATSHCLGQNFSRMFEIQFETQPGQKEYAWQNSWGITTRTIGIMTLLHGDDRGLVLPPRIAPIQVIVVPIYPRGNHDPEPILQGAREIVAALTAVGIRAQGDFRDTYTAPYKFNHWELKGVPIRLEYGPQDHANSRVTLVQRNQLGLPKAQVARDQLVPTVTQTLQTMQAQLFAAAQAQCQQHLVQATTWAGFMTALNAGNRVMAPWCGQSTCEESIKKRSGEETPSDTSRLSGSAKSLCVPFQQPQLPANAVCFACGAPAVNVTLFGRSY
jgi:prolyl-tRNA synthetase